MPNDASNVPGGTTPQPPVGGSDEHPVPGTAPAQPGRDQSGLPPINVTVNIPTAAAPPAQVVNIPPPKTHRLRNILIGCVVLVGIAFLALKGCTSGLAGNSWSGNPGPVITAPAPTTPAPPPLSHVPPHVATAATIGVHELGNQQWIDINATFTNKDGTPVQDLGVSFQQDGHPLAITQSPWNGDPGINGATDPYALGSYGTAPSQVFEIDMTKTPVDLGKPIDIVVYGNGVRNSTSAPAVNIACPTTTVNGGDVTCQLPQRQLPGS